MLSSRSVGTRPIGGLWEAIACRARKPRCRSKSVLKLTATACCRSVCVIQARGIPTACLRCQARRSVAPISRSGTTGWMDSTPHAAAYFRRYCLFSKEAPSDGCSHAMDCLGTDAAREVDAGIQFSQDRRTGRSHRFIATFQRASVLHVEGRPFPDPGDYLAQHG